MIIKETQKTTSVMTTIDDNNTNHTTHKQLCNYFKTKRKKKG